MELTPLLILVQVVELFTSMSAGAVNCTLYPAVIGHPTVKVIWSEAGEAEFVEESKEAEKEGREKRDSIVGARPVTYSIMFWELSMVLIVNELVY